MRQASNHHTHHLPAVAVTRGPGHHFFGYYDKAQFNHSGTRMLGLRCDMIGRLQTPEDRATVGIVDLQAGNQWTPLAETAAWNWQMGCMAEWMPGSDCTFIHNDRRDGRFVSVVRDVAKGEQRVFPQPIYELSPDGKSALTLSFSRLWNVRPETGYCGIQDPWRDDPAPHDDGIYRVDLTTGESKLLISHADMAGFATVADMPRDSQKYFTHLLFNSDGSRFMFWYRCEPAKPGSGFNQSSIYTASADGKSIDLLGSQNSHCTWLGWDKVLAWSNHRQKGLHTYLLTDQSDRFEVVGDGLLEFNGHASFSRDGRWLLTDVPPNEKDMRTLVLYDWRDRQRYDIGTFHAPRSLAGAMRCDLHPRWNHAGTQVCIDSVHEGTRQMYVIDVSELVG